MQYFNLPVNVIIDFLFRFSERWSEGRQSEEK